MGGLATDVEDKFGDLTSFRYVIIAASTNDAQLLHDDGLAQEESWEDMCHLLRPLINNPHTTVIFNSGIGFPLWPRVPSYTTWLRTLFTEEFGSANNFAFMDWSTPSHYNFFLDADGQAVAQFTNQVNPLGNLDGKHPSEQGIRKMWRSIIQEVEIARGMAPVALGTSSTPYQAGRLYDFVSLAD
jgi:hypothetical protein